MTAINGHIPGLIALQILIALMLMSNVSSAGAEQCSHNMTAENRILTATSSVTMGTGLAALAEVAGNTGDEKSARLIVSIKPRKIDPSVPFGIEVYSGSAVGSPVPEDRNYIGSFAIFPTKSSNQTVTFSLRLPAGGNWRQAACGGVPCTDATGEFTLLLRPNEKTTAEVLTEIEVEQLQVVN